MKTQMILTLLCASAVATHAQRLVHTFQLEPTDHPDGVAISAQFAVIAANGGDFPPTQRVRVYSRVLDGTWTKEAELEAGKGYATPIEISGTLIVVGNTWDGDLRGAALAYSRRNDGNWTRETKLTDPEGGSNHLFGADVAVDGSLVVVGGVPDPPFVFKPGTAIVYARRHDGTWVQEARLTPPQPAQFDGFGSRVALSGDSVLVTSGTKAHFFKRNSNGQWLHEMEFQATKEVNSKTVSLFPRDVALYENLATVSSFESNGFGRALLEIVTVFARNAQGKWEKEATLEPGPEDAGKDFGFGKSIALTRNRIVVGLPDEHYSSTILFPQQRINFPGLAYVFARNSDGKWLLENRLLGPKRDNQYRQFGAYVSIFDNSVLISEWGANAAHLYSFPYFRFDPSAIVPTPAGVRLEFTVSEGDTYTIQKSTDLVRWTDLATAKAVTRKLTFTDSSPASDGPAFYRATVR